MFWSCLTWNFRSQYAKPEDIDLFIGIIVETVTEGSAGPTAACIIGRCSIIIKDGHFTGLWIFCYISVIAINFKISSSFSRNFLLCFVSLDLVFNFFKTIQKFSKSWFIFKYLKKNFCEINNLLTLRKTIWRAEVRRQILLYTLKGVK